MQNREPTIDSNINNIKNLIGNKSELVIKYIFIGDKNSLTAAVIYLNAQTDKNIIDRDILNPLMLHIHEDISTIKNLDDYLCKKYISASNTIIETDINKLPDDINSGKTVIVIDGISNFIVVDTTGGMYRQISEPINDVSLRGPREGFVENIETNISILRRRIKDKKLTLHKFKLGRRSQSNFVIMYIDDIVDKEFLKSIEEKISKIDKDFVSTNSIIEQLIEEHSYSVFPQTIGSERPDIIEAALMEGRIAFLLEGTPYVTTYPTTFIEFFQTTEDYYGRTVQTVFIRIIRFIAAFIVITAPAIYITLTKFNAELIPVEYIESLIAARKGIALTPFMSLLGMNLTIELLREGGLRLPGKIGQTLSLVGGIIIGDAAIKAKIVSSSTLFVAGISTVASFVISNYQMSIAIRILSYPMLILSNWLGILGIIVGWFFILSYLCAFENFGVPYFEFNKGDMKDTFIRTPVKNMKERPKIIPNVNPLRQKIRGKNK
ncbi:spore germination protein [Clostridium autoethanogenum]|uniref:Spore germination protein n=1 Tax=Clostridium autoethanogenum TaxID=84023 RepID=A0A3M0SVF6_9CLOT|nr:spore germination protein [Clostridium autoethanogenum]RMD02377.1 spore germination protein [Clostridium autoethanogenum]